MENEVFHRPKGGIHVEKLLSKVDADGRVKLLKPIRWTQQFYKPLVQRRPTKLRDDDRSTRITNSPGSVVLSLFDLCLTFIAENADAIESLEDFPDQLGKRLWDKCVELEVLLRPGKITSEVLDLFCTAYPDFVLPQCQLRSLHLLNNYEDEFKVMLKTVTVLDLGRCKLGDRHDLLPSLRHFCNLQYLSLASNSISSAGVRLLSGLADRTSERFPKLLLIDLTDNPTITHGAIKRYIIEQVESLLYVTLSYHDSSSATAGDALFKPTFTRRTFKVPNNPLEQMSTTKDECWASILIQRWKKRVEDKLSAKKSEQIVSSRQFYNRPSQPAIRKPLGLLSGNSNTSTITYERQISPPAFKKRKINSAPEDPELENDEETDLLAIYKR